MRLMGWSFNDGVAGDSISMHGSVAAPAAGGTIVSMALPNGLYTVEWVLELSGTVAAADADNVSAQIASTRIAQSANQGAVGQYPQPNAQGEVTGGPLTLAFKAIGAATAGSTYDIDAVVTAVNPSTATIQDGSGAIAFSAIPVGGVDNQWWGDSGIAIDTGLSVVATNGIVQGVLWYYIAPERRWEDEQSPTQEN